MDAVGLHRRRADAVVADQRVGEDDDLAGVGGVAVRGDEKLHRHPATAVTYGVGLALIVDEFALLLDLQDVYWAKQGRISVDVAIGGIAAAGSVFAALPVLRKVARRLRERGKETESQPAVA